MAESSNESEIGVSFVNDTIKSMADEIAEILDLDGNESKGQIVNDLFENGRQSLVNYEEDIICERYKDMMNGSENKLMCLLKKYYQQKWELQCGKSNPWFISFIEKYQNGENHDIYERVLTHAAEYGDKHTENYRILSIVLQFLFETIDDECWTKTKLFDDQYLKEQPTFDSQYLRETEDSNDPFLTETSICDGLWYAITHDGLKSITKYSDYIVPLVMHEQLNKDQSILFQALREYYRTQLFSLLKENRIADRQQLYDLALDNVAEHGWLTGIQVIQQKVAPKYYRSLLESLNSLLQKRKAQANQALKQQEGNKERNVQGENKKPEKQGQNKAIEKQEQNAEEEGQAGNKNPDKTFKNKNAKKKEESKTQKAQNQNEDLNGQDRSKKLEKEGANKESNREEEDKEQKQQATSNLQGTNTCSENKQTEANLTEAAVARNQETDEEGKPNKTNDLGNLSQTTSEVKPDDIVPRISYEKNKIFISGLPKTMAEQHLLGALSRMFSSTGQIKINSKTKQPWIVLHRKKDNKYEFFGSATIVFENEDSTMKAIEKYNQQCIPAFNDARIYVSEATMKNNRAEPEPSLQPTQRSPDQQPQAIDSSKIFITGLPTNMSEQVLFGKLEGVFSTAGEIKINRKTNKPWINLHRQKDNKSQLSGAALITFEEEKSTITAIKNYHRKCISALDNAQIYVRKFKKENERPTSLATRMPPKPLSPVRAGPGQPDGLVNIFWDIENAAIPAGHNAFKVAMKLQQMLITDRNRAKGSFMTYCNTRTISEEHHNGLSNAGVKIQHVPNRKIGAVDQHILMALQDFGVHQKESCTMVLISGDVDFILLLNKLRFDYKHYVIVVHNRQAKSELLQTANEAHPWEKFTENCCEKTKINPEKKTKVLKVSNANGGSNVARTSNIHNRTESPKMRPLMGMQLPFPAGGKASELILCGPHDSTDTHQPTLQNPLISSEKPKVAKSQTRQKMDRPKKKSPGFQPPGPLQSFTDDLTKNTLMDCNLVVQTTDNTHALEKQNDTAKNGHSFFCFECNRKFPTNAAQVQHQKDKHKLGELIQFSSLTSINDLNSHCQSSVDGGQPENDLIAFDDGDDYGLSQASSMSATKETITLIDFEDDNNDTDGGECENVSESEEEDVDMDDVNDSENDIEDVGVLSTLSQK